MYTCEKRMGGGEGWSICSIRSTRASSCVASAWLYISNIFEHMYDTYLNISIVYIWIHISHTHDSRVILRCHARFCISYVSEYICHVCWWNISYIHDSRIILRCQWLIMYMIHIWVYVSYIFEYIYHIFTTAASSCATSAWIHIWGGYD